MVRLIAASLVFIGTTHVAAAQSLGDVAKKEEARRKTVKASGKVYTNDELKPAPQPSSTPPPASTDQSASAPASGSTASDAAPAATASPKGDEASWRRRMTDARDAVQRLETFAAALQNQLNSLATDFVNRDDPVQRSGIAQKRDSVSAELERVKKDIAAKTKAISDIQNEARKAGVPAGWVR
jgi:DNA repair exonuclease SbcCD ATPase subunit